MSHEEKDTYVELFTTLFISIPYLIIVFFRFQNTDLTLEEQVRYWAIAFLILIPIKIVAHIIVYIIMAIISTIVTGEEPDDISDERDKLIDLKSNRNAYYTFAIGMLLAMILVAIGKPITTMFGVFVVAGVLAEFVDIFSKIIFYRRGY